MARKLLPLDEAAQLLGVSPAELNSLRERHMISAYKDGTSWKFKSDEVERLKEDIASGNLGMGADAEFAELGDDQESILTSEQELGGSSPGSGSTIIGQADSPANDLDLALPDASDVRLADDLDLLPTGSGLSSKFDDLDTLDLELPSASESGLTPKPQPKSDLNLAGVDELSLGESDLALGEDPAAAGSSPTMKGTGSALDLGGEDDELVLGGSGAGSDVTHAPADSGISLMSPSDSGLSIEQEVSGLGGSAIESLDMGEEDMILLEEEKAPAGGAEDDFLLTPLAEGTDESDSGSQVIALDAESDLDDSAATMLGGAAAPMLEEDLGAVDLGGPALGAGVGLGGAAGPALIGAAPQAAEATFSAATVLLLVTCALPLALSGMMLYDLIRHMWSWDQPYALNSKLIDAVLGIFGK